MKKQSSTGKTFIDEFTDYFESIYDPQADYDSLPDELLQWEYQRFLEMIAR